MPSHADWLNDRSLMVPSSATMQPVNLAAPVAVGELELFEAGVVLLPQATSSMVATAPTATVAANEAYFNFPPLAWWFTPKRYKGAYLIDRFLGEYFFGLSDERALSRSKPACC
jgi:hypothetical protein